MNVSKENLIPLIRTYFSAIPDSGIRNLIDARRVSTLVDNTYTTLKKMEVVSTLKSNPLLTGSPEITTNSELFDCDDYALQLKSSLTALYRAKRLVSDLVQPPAIGIIITQTHAINILICASESTEPEIFLIDPSIKSPKLTNDPTESASLLKTLPISLIYI